MTTCRRFLLAAAAAGGGLFLLFRLSPVSPATAEEKELLLEFKGDVTADPGGALASWSAAPGRDPCGDFAGVTCGPSDAVEKILVQNASLAAWTLERVDGPRTTPVAKKRKSIASLLSALSLGPAVAATGRRTQEGATHRCDRPPPVAADHKAATTSSVTVLFSHSTAAAEETGSPSRIGREVEDEVTVTAKKKRGTCLLPVHLPVASPPQSPPHRAATAAPPLGSPPSPSPLSLPESLSLSAATSERLLHAPPPPRASAKLLLSSVGRRPRLPTASSAVGSLAVPPFGCIPTEAPRLPRPAEAPPYAHFRRRPPAVRRRPPSTPSPPPAAEYPFSPPTGCPPFAAAARPGSLSRASTSAEA
ncbi:proline-rich protein 36-like [Phoenix dactylifera]|uniref:Proline-rich protein 36-like n=1 Tax=Phoenix dactylifera TaxID=42345 RepID=A0A8B9AI42_PHODC|nr:proline-rich protein 36-like [Phoenix dactylifera]